MTCLFGRRVRVILNEDCIRFLFFYRHHLFNYGVHLISQLLLFLSFDSLFLKRRRTAE